MTIFSCNQCQKSFSSKMALQGHKHKHNTNKKKIALENNVSYKHMLERKDLYNQNPTLCLKCNKPLPYERRNLKFCDHSCQASYVNSNRTRSDTAKANVKNTLKKLYVDSNEIVDKLNNNEIIDIPNNLQSIVDKLLERQNRKKEKALLPPKTIVDEATGKTKRKLTCKQCSETFYHFTYKKHCDKCAPLFMAESRNRYKFTFNVFLYPEFFDLIQLQLKGWFAPKGKTGRWNPDGLSRDHKVSVNEAIRNNYDPFYITHPLNCELMIHRDNNIKNTNSSISYEELVRQVNAYELNKKV